MVERIRATECALGDGVKRPQDGELETAALVRRSWHTVSALPAGHVIAESDLMLKRPANGLAPTEMPVGRTLTVAKDADTAIMKDDLDERLNRSFVSDSSLKNHFS